MQFVPIFSVSTCCESPILPHPEDVLLDSDPAKWLGRLTGEHGTHCHVHKTSVRQLWLCDMVHYHTGSGHDRTNTVSYNTQKDCGVQVIIGLLKVWCVEHSEMLFCLLQLYRAGIWFNVAFLSVQISLAIPCCPLWSTRHCHRQNHL